MPNSFFGVIAAVDPCASKPGRSSVARRARGGNARRIGAPRLILAVLALVAVGGLSACDRQTAIAWLDAGVPEVDAGVDAGFDAGVDAGCPRPCGVECCTADQTCLAGHCSDCTPENDETFCSRLGRACGPLAGTDNCEQPRTVEDCGACGAGEHCDEDVGACAIDCPPEDPALFCQRHNAVCGTVTDRDTCNVTRTIDCGECGLHEECDVITNHCRSICETDTAFCARLGRTCGPAGGVDNCEQNRQVASCGGCVAPLFCGASGTCESCPSETDDTFCSRMGKNCGSVSGTDNCGNARTVVNCGACAVPETCGLNQICAPAGHQSNENCTRPELLAFDTTGHAHTQGSTYLGANDDQPFLSTKCAGTGPDLVYFFTLNRRQNVDVVLSPSFPTGALPNVAVRSDCTLRFTELDCASLDAGSPGGLFLRNLNSGTYFVWVDAAGISDFGPFQLDLQLSNPASPPANDTCAAPEVLNFNSSGVATVSGSTLDATDDYQGAQQGSCATSSGPDVVYQFTLGNDASVSAQLTRGALARTYKPAIYMRSSCASPDIDDERACGGTLASAVAYSSVGRLTAGTYYLIVDGLAGSSGPFTLEVTIGAPNANDSCTSPYAPEELLFDPAGVATAQGDTSIANPDTTNGCNGGAGNDLVYWFTLGGPGPKDVDIQVTPDVGGPYRPSVSIRSICDQNGSEFACALSSSAGTSVRLLYSQLPMGTYYVWVDGPAGTSGRFTLQVSAQDPPPPPVNDVCAGALQLTFNSTTNVATATDTTLYATDGTSGSCQTASAPLSGNDVYYYFTLSAPRVVSAKITRDAADGSYRPAVSLRTDCTSYAAPSELACAVTANVNVAFAETTKLRLDVGTYYVVVDGADGSHGGYTLQVTAAPLPANDTCASPEWLDLTTSLATTSGDTTFAFNDNMTTSCFTGTWGNDLVYSFSVATLSALEVNVTPTAGSTLGAYLSLRTACANDATTVPGSCKFAVPGVPAVLNVSRLPAGTYYLWVDSQFSMGAFTMSVATTPVTVASNDTCGGATPLTIDSVTHLASATGDTRTAFNDYHGTCQAAGDNGADTVYLFEMRSPASLTATVTPAAGSSNYKPAVYLRTTCTSSASSAQKACAAATAGGLPATVNIPLLAPGNYALIVDGANDGEYSLLITEGPAVLNDNCTAPNSAQQLVFDPTTLTATTSGDTSVGNNDTEGSCYSNSLGKDVVYTFTLAAEANIQATLAPAPASTYVPNMYIRTSCSSPSSEVACRTSTAAAPLMMNARLPAGTYYLWIDGFSSIAGAFDLSVVQSPTAVVAGDQCGNAIPITLGANGRAMLTGNTTGAANDYRGGCDSANMRSTGGDVVYSLTLQSDAKVTVTVTRTVDLQPAVYIRSTCSGTTLSNEVGCADSGISATASNTWLTAGTYYIVVDGVAGGQDGPFMMLVITEPPVRNDTCRGVESLTFTGGVATFSGDSSRATGGDAHGTCNSHPYGGDLVYSFTLTAPQAVEITAQPTNASSQFRPDLIVRSVCNSPDGDFAAELGCAYVYLANTPATLRLPALRAGTYYLWVATGYADPAWNGPFTGTVTLSPAPALPANDTCGTAELITPDSSGHATINATTVGAINDSGGTCADLGAGEVYNGGDVVYYLPLTAESSLVARVRGPAFLPAVYIRRNCASGAAADEVGCGVHLRINGNLAANAYATASAPRVPPGTYYIIVDGMAQTAAGFTLDVQVGPPMTNDSCAAPTQLIFNGSGVAEVIGDTSLATSTTDSSCIGVNMQGRDAVYAFTLTRTSAVQIDATTTTPAIYGPALYLRTSCDQTTTELGCALDPGTGASNLSFPLLGAGTYYLWVDSDTRWKMGPFALRVTASNPTVTPAPNDYCPGTDLTFDVSTHRAFVTNDNTAMGGHDFGATCDAAIGPDLVYRIDTTQNPQPQKLVVTLTRNAATATWTPVMYLRNSCGGSDAAGEVSCVKGAATATLTVNNLPSGTWYLIVDGSLGTAGRFDLQAELSPAVAGAPTNESCFNPTTLSLVANHTSVNGTTAGAQNEATGSCSFASGPDVVYSLTTGSTGRISATVTPSPLSATYSPAVYLRRQCGSPFAADEAACGKTLSGGAAASTSVSGAAAGPWFIWVDSANNATPGDFTLDVTFTPTNPVPNDTCSSPVALLAGTTVTSTTAPAAANYTGLLNLLSCGGVAVGGPDLVYTYLPSASGPFTVTVTPSGWTATLWMATASCGVLNDCLAAGSPGTGGTTSITYANGVAGTPYYLVVTGFGAGDSGPFDIRVQ